MDNPRKLALESLIKSEKAGAYTNLELNATIKRVKLAKIDVALYTALYLGVVEKMITLDYQITQYSKSHILELDIETKNALRLGFYQLIFMDKIPDYSAVSETVDLCPRRSRGFVNACLRSFIRDGKHVAYPMDSWEALSVKTSIPVSILNIFKASYGMETAVEIAESCKPREGLCLRVNLLKTDPREIRAILKTRKISYKHVGLSEELVVIKAPISDFADLIENGYVFVQDSASFACTKILAPKKGEMVLDACACPGGKSFSSAIIMQNEGKIISCDLHANKLKLVTDGAKRLGISIIHVKEQDAKLENEAFIKKFDKVLCDVPCSGLGVMAKKPDIKYKPIEQIYNLPEIQLQILRNCSKYVKAGGELVYSTCTLNAEENENVIKKFLASNDSFEAVEFKLGDIESTNGMFTFMPHKLEADGFFVAKMRRVK